ncbi:hypothetical protein [Candidatus Liberibacter americanus]|uniref:Uncharacterized protein n=1 Tax=Candidatus Liberibacter americanus str. Sao Paulo TaxID=1261131 RepID=U6B848_9HYPH|nr:hypothetical protein [Candidatus Liberibacter americanus]AHA28041.1 hypothetical protein lam_695 [Candidatus Liberibacter americanus str. Sao Paulo]EMS35816.1 hypothetical protein G653_04706 [Candidatus Liberibacter americanus PW_SP]
MNKVIIGTIAFLGLVLGGCGSMQNNQTEHKEGINMAENKQKTLQEIDARILYLQNRVLDAEKKYLSFDDFRNLFNKAKESSDLLQKCIDSDEYTGSDVTTRSAKLEAVRLRILDAYNDFVKETNDAVVADTTKTEAKLKDTISALESVPFRDSWGNYPPLRRSLDQQSDKIKQVRDESIEKIYAEIQSFIDDQETRLKQAIEARKHKDFDIGHIHIENFYDKFIHVLNNLQNTRDRWLNLKGNTSLLSSKYIVLLKKLNDLAGRVDKLPDMGSTELEYLKNSDIKDEELCKLFTNLNTEASGFVSEANKKMDQGDYDSALRLLRKGHRSRKRSDNFYMVIKARYDSGKSSISLARFNEITTKDNYIGGEITKGFSRVRSGTAYPFPSPVFLDRLKLIESSLKEAKVVIDQVSAEIVSYIKYQKRLAPSTIDSSKRESQAVKVSSDGSITPYKDGDVLNTGDRIGYTYTSLGQLPSIDTNDAFNSLSGKPRRIISSSVRVLNTRNLEVGTDYQKMYPVKGLEKNADSGEFRFFPTGGFSPQDGLLFRQSGADTGVITSFIINLGTGV